MISDRDIIFSHGYTVAVFISGHEYNPMSKNERLREGVLKAFARRIGNMYIIKTEQSFDSAHFLAGYEGKCRNLHGHRWRVIVEVCSEHLQEEGQLRGMVTDFGDIKEDLKALADAHDHAFIYEKGTLRQSTLTALREEEFHLIEVPFRPTAENFARYFYELLQGKGYCMKSVEVYETPNNCAIYCE